MKITQIDGKPLFVEEIRENISVVEDSIEIPQENQVIRTKKSQTEGKVQKVVGNEVFFHLADGRLMKTNISNVIVVEKLADEDDEVMEDGISAEIGSKYQKECSMKENKSPSIKHKQVKKTDEGTMGGLNRCAPAQDVSYQDVLSDVYDKWKGDTVKVTETGPYYDRFEEILAEMDDELVNEVSKSTLGSYIKKASKDVSDRSNEVGWKAGVANPKYNTSDDTHKEVKRHQGIGRAVSKLSK